MISRPTTHRTHWHNATRLFAAYLSGRDYQKKLRELMAECEEIKLLPLESKAMDSVRKNVEKTMTDIKKWSKADEFLSQV